MLNKFVVAIFLSLVCHAFALDSHNSPVLIFKHKENTKSYDSGVVSATTQVKQRDFEQRLRTLDAGQKIMVFVASDLSPEDLAFKNEKHEKAFGNLASNLDIVDYMLFVENAVNNKVTQGQDVAHTEVSAINELEEEPSSDKRIIIVKLPGYHVSEQKFHWLRRIDRALYAVSQLPQYKDYLFVLTSEQNSRLQQHSRKRRAADTPTTPTNHSDANILVYFKDFVQKNKKTADESILTGPISSTKAENTITLTIESKFPLKLAFDYEPAADYWALNTATSTISGKPLDGKVQTQIGAPKNISFSCSSAVYFTVDDENVAGVYFKGFQVQPNINGTDKLTKFGDSYDCTGFVSIPIWSGLFITFLLLGIVATAVSYIMDIRTMDRFDDPKGKTITITASE
ncbi:V-type proton ATPase subunit S1 [Sitodiplosis mosellana]|uniref:V-type proton ATPase subunit S1 n=1 Tax=Sitodiplosis mosellana TaxID=263140 RepID=UPI002444BA78|nr:V-type proton ATPase subunit S1 [Sitodiplosis mosellana]